MAKKKKAAPKPLKEKFDEAYVKMRGEASKERESKANCPCGCKGKCVCGRGT